MSPSEIQRMKLRRDAAIQALAYFKYKPVKSLNKPFALRPSADQLSRHAQMVADTAAGGGHVLANAHAVMTHGVGNCADKASIVFLSLTANPYINQNQQLRGVSTQYSEVTMLRMADGDGPRFDHVFICVHDKPVVTPLGYRFRLSDLPKTTLYVDAWTEDWWFPNISTMDAIRYGLTNPPSIFQRVTRRRVMSDDLRVDEMNLSLTKNQWLASETEFKYDMNKRRL